MNHPAILDYTFQDSTGQIHPENYRWKNVDAINRELKFAINYLVDDQFKRDLRKMRLNVGAAYLAEPLWKAYLLSFILNMDCTNDTIRRIEENPLYGEICGFNPNQPFPSRWTFERFIISLTEHPELIEKLLNKAVNKLHEYLPEFGMTVAIDSTPVKSYSSPSKKSDLQAGFIVKEGIPHKVWKWGYKLHLLIDVASELPIVCEISLAKESDVASLIPLINKAKTTFSWFKPWHIIADKGYDAGYNYKAIHDMGDIPIIKMKNDSQGQEKRITLDENGIPHCSSGLQLLQTASSRKGIVLRLPFQGGQGCLSFIP